MMGGTVAGDTQSEAALMNTITDPKAFADRLQQLTTKSNEVQQYLGQAKENNVQAEAERKKAEEINAATVDLVRQINEKEANLATREGALETWVQNLANQKSAFAASQAEIEAKQREIQADLDKRTAALSAAEQAYARKVEKETAAAAEALAAKTASLEGAYQSKVAALNQAMADAAAQGDAAKAALAAAEKSKALYEGKLADLKKLVSA